MSRPTPVNRCRHVVVFGRPGSGKSSLADRLGSRFGFALVRTGELLREDVRRGDALGLQAESDIRQGKLVPDEMIAELLERSLKPIKDQSFLFDGFPRTLGQAKTLETLEKRLNFTVDRYLEVEISRADAVARMAGRRVCPTCGATYHLVAKPPLVPGRCDLDSTPLEQRRDDDPAVIEQRQQVYEDFAGPVLRFYKITSPERFVVVDGSGTPDEVFRATYASLGLTLDEPFSP